MQPSSDQPTKGRGRRNPYRSPLSPYLPCCGQVVPVLLMPRKFRKGRLDKSGTGSNKHKPAARLIVRPGERRALQVSVWSNFRGFSLQRQGHGGAVAPAGERAGEPTSSWFFATTCPFASIRLRYVRRGCHPAAGAPPLACAELCRCLVSVQSAAQACNELFIVELLPPLRGRLLIDAKTRRQQRCGVISSGAA